MSIQLDGKIILIIADIGNMCRTSAFACADMSLRTNACTHATVGPLFVGGAS